MFQRACLSIVMVMALVCSFSSRADSAWESYKSRFMMPDGRIVDTGNGNISHTEGQGFAMLMAVANNDRPAFDKLWQWTNSTLKNKDNGLFYWRYNPVAPDPIADKNNASDGDVFIAWALLLANKRWHDNGYITASDAITRALVKHTVISWAGYRVMLPGAKGFNLNSRITLNPSYFVFPAWQAFADRSHMTVWRDLLRDGHRLLDGMQFGTPKLATDWVSVTPDGKMKPANEWPPRMSYDAIRIPLYLRWQDASSAQLTPWRNWFQSQPRANTPAWINVVNGETAPYPMSGGLLAVRDYTLGTPTGEPQITAQDDYYSASLKMLVWLAESK